MSEAMNTIAAIRGAIQVAENRADLVQAATARLLTELLARNALEPGRIVSAIFTATPDLDADFPAHAARRLGWTDVPLLGAVEIAVPGALPRVVRVLLTVGGLAPGRKLEPVYLEGAAALRPDLASRGSQASEPRGPHAVALIGLGQIGGSIGLTLAADRRWRRIGFDRDPAVLRTALEAGAVDEVAESIAAACAGAHLAVIATPVDTIPAGITAAADALPAGAALLDTGSARTGITEALAAATERGVRAVGGHPLAGTEGHGFASARAGLFRDAGFALFATEAALPGIVRELVEALGARPLAVSPGDHDAALARTSHLPYLVARSLRVIGGADAERGLSGPAFRDMTRVAGSDPRMAEAYCRANLAGVRRAWEKLREEIERQIATLESPAAG
jgi:monofunctional chorismate mutase